MSRKTFRERCVDRDGGQCIVPWCQSAVSVDPDGTGEVHHIIERELWPDGGYIENNGASVCNDHHRMAENSEIPPQAFYRWAGIEQVPLPPTVTGQDSVTTVDVSVDGNSAKVAYDKWGEPFEAPPHSHLKDYHKYPSTRHLLPLYYQSERGTAAERLHNDDTGFQSVETFLDIPLVATVKLDGSNTMLVADHEEPVRARNGSAAEHDSFDRLKQEYWDRNVYENLPEHLQVFGENLYAKHSIHYGCDGCCDERNRGPALDAIFYVFGVYDTRYHIWLSWPETEQVADELGFPVAPGAGGHPLNEPVGYDVNDYYCGEYESSHELIDYVLDRAERTVDTGHEGIIVRSLYPLHYGQFEQKVGKYVRQNHVQTDEHWSHTEVVENEVGLE